MYLCIGGKAPYYIPITRIQHLAIREHPSKTFQLKIKFTTALTFYANTCEILIAAKLMTEETARAAPSTSSPESLNLMRKWISTCMSQHFDCNKPLWTDSPTTKAPGTTLFPTRLIDVRPIDISGNVRLFLSTTEEKEWQAGKAYLALSHYWGAIPILRLTSAVLHDFMRRIEIASLPQTFRDAIMITEGSNIATCGLTRYLSFKTQQRTGRSSQTRWVMSTKMHC